ncbi:MAG: sensor domain-containing diguanylate cyclase [candidate division Zixibacteria bacterium]|nr:sensor domain-containing diguanylate cyclase [candidate division Zixibacteria bacterium]
MTSKKETNLWSLLSQPRWIFWFIRGIIFLSFVFWMLSSPEHDHRIWLLLAFFLAYSLVAFIFAGKAKTKGEKLYFLTSILDIVLITFAGLITNGEESGFFLLYFLVVPFGSYVAGLIPGFSLAFLSSVFYLSINAKDFAGLSVSSVLVKIVALWALSVVVGVVVKEMKYSKSKLLRMFDILNQRTSELEKSQAQIETIYETSRTLGEILNLDEVVEEIQNIVQKILGYRFFSIFILAHQNTLSLLGEITEGKKIKYPEPKAERLKGILREVVSTGKPKRILDVTKDPNFKLSLEGTKSFMAVPMISRGNVIGVMDARSTRMGAFLDQDEKIFSILAGSAAMAVENALLHQKTKELTIVDELTDLYNFRYFSNKLRAEIRRAKRYHLPLSLIMVDIDWFKRCNDTYGHLFGNRVLQDLAQRVKESVRDVDVACRYGGEEFAVILPQTKKLDAQMIGERIRHRVESTDFVSDTKDSKVKITVSLGVASFPENGSTTKDLIEQVDKALYLAKGRGKNLVCTV